MRKEIGKVISVRIGFGGYQNAQLGVSWDLGSNGWGVNDFWGAWGMEHNKTHQWTQEDRLHTLGETMWRLRNVMTDANVTTADRLVGRPVEVTFEDNQLKSWRILREAI